MAVDVQRHVSREELDAGVHQVRGAPREVGTVELVVRRPAEGEREVLDVGELDLVEGLVGDSWKRRRTRSTPDGSPNPDMQLNVMSARVVDLVAGGARDRWPLAGDQLYLDLDLSEEHLPVGTRLALGDAVIEVTPPPHTGCAKFMKRFGVDAHKFVNAKEHRPLRLRGLCAKVVQPGTVRPGDAVRKL
jgi:hypothetical protein